MQCEHCGHSCEGICGIQDICCGQCVVAKERGLNTSGWGEKPTITISEIKEGTNEATFKINNLFGNLIFNAFAAGWRAAESAHGNTEEPEMLIRALFLSQWEEIAQKLSEEGE